MAFSHSFPNYDLHLTTIPGKNSKVMIVAHGMGANHTIVENVESDDTLITFNFPDYDFIERNIQAEKTTYGTPDEILPLLFVIKKFVIDKGHSEIDLYGFSAGGGAIINAIGALNSSRFDDSLKQINIESPEKQIVLKAIQKGQIILDCPLTSVREIIDFKGYNHELNVFSKRYQMNDMEPINAIKYLQGLSMNILVHFQKPDEILSNRDDSLFFNRLKEINLGKTELVIGYDGGHNTHHKTLWDLWIKRHKQ